MELFYICSAHICTNNQKLLTAESGSEGTRQSACILESIIAMKIFVSYSKWPGGLGSIGYMFIVFFSTVCTFDPTGPFFPKLYASYFLWKLSFFLLARVC